MKRMYFAYVRKQGGKRILLKSEQILFTMSSTISKLSTTVLTSSPLSSSVPTTTNTSMVTTSLSSSTTSSSSEPLPIIIIGGGLAGLGLALALQKENIPVVVYERDNSFEYRKQGYGMTLQAFQPLQELGIYDEVRQADTASLEHWTFTPDGNILGYFGRNLGMVHPSTIINSETNTNDTTVSTASIIPTNVGVSTERGNIRIPREILRCILLSHLKPNTVQWGYKLLQFIECPNNTVKCTFEMNTSPSSSSSSTESSSNSIEINGSLLVGADGIHSNVRKGLEHINYTKTSNLSYLGVFLILGISTYQHYLLKNKGFYTIDGKRRLFTMPFTENTKDHPTYKLYNQNNNNNDDDNQDSTPPSLTMWQLSFALDNEEEAKEISKYKPHELLHRALKETQNWHAPVPDLLQHTILNTSLQLWGTPLYDFGEAIPSIPGRLFRYYKDKSKRYKGNNDTEISNNTETIVDFSLPPPGRNYYVNPLVTLIGDAAHPMSPFKGQGANQALRDGPALAKWIKKAWPYYPTSSSNIPDNSDSDPDHESDISNNKPHKRKHTDKGPRGTLSTAILSFEREMMTRAGAKVVASREAAHYFHSVQVLNEPQKIAGIKDEDVPAILQKARDFKIGAWCNDTIIPKFCEIITQFSKESQQTE